MALWTAATRKSIAIPTLRYLRQALASSSYGKSSLLRWCRPKSSSTQTYYDLFPRTLGAGPPPSGPFRIDAKRLKTEFLQLQARAHPDLHPLDKKSQAETISSRINAAYKTLSDPLSRAQYILSLHYGTDVSSDEAAKLDGGDGSPGGKDAELLMMVMEAREAIEDATSEDDLVDVKKNNDVRIADAERLLERAFAEHDWNTAKRETVRLRYWIGIRNGIEDWASYG